MPGSMKVNGAFKAGTLVAPVGFVHSPLAQRVEISDGRFTKIKQIVTRIDELLI